MFDSRGYFFSILLVFVSIICASMGFSVYAKETKNKIYKVFLVFNLSLVAWSVSILFVFLKNSTIAGRTTMISGLLIAWSFVVFSTIFPKPIQVAKIKKILRTVIALLFIVISTSGLVVKRILPADQVFSFKAELGPFFLVYIIIFLSYFICGFRNLFVGYRNGDEKNKKQIVIFLTGWIIGVFIAFICNLLAPLLGIFWLVKYGPIFSMLIIPILTIYAMIKYSFLNIKMIAIESLVVGIIFIGVLDFISAIHFWEMVFEGLILVLLLFFGKKLIDIVEKEIEEKNKAKYLAEKTKKVNEKLKSLDTIKSEFLSIASHQLRTPLTVIKGYISMVLSGDFGKLENDKINEVLKKVYESSDYIIRLVNKLLNLSRIERGKIFYEFSPCDLNELVKRLIKTSDFSVDNKVKIILELQKNMPQIFVDREKIEDVIFNLLDNARKYTTEGKIIIKTYFDKKEGKVFFSVKDTGLGIDKKNQKRIFEKFYRAATKTNVNGCGIGLYIIKEIVKKHKGDIWFKSQGLGKGTEFIFCLNTIN